MTSSDGGFPDRLRMALRGKSIRSFATIADISHAAMNQYLRGASEPSRVNLIRIAEAAGVSLEWLATGKGEMEPNDAAPTPSAPHTPAVPATDAELLALLMGGISKTYKEVSARISPEDMGRLAARHHDQICAATDDPDGRRFMAKLVFVQLRADLTAPVVGDATQTKRLA